MRRFWVRAFCIALLGLMAGAAGAGVAKASAALAHACCDDGSKSPAAPGAEACHGFLPLSCCHAPALPGSDAGPPAPAGLVLAMWTPPTARPSARRGPNTDSLAPRPPPARLSVVLQL